MKQRDANIKKVANRLFGRSTFCVAGSLAFCIVGSVVISHADRTTFALDLLGFLCVVLFFLAFAALYASVGYGFRQLKRWAYSPARLMLGCDNPFQRDAEACEAIDDPEVRQAFDLET